MEDNKSGIAVYKNMYKSKKDNQHNIDKKSLIILNIIILIISTFVPFVGIPIYILWKNDRPKDKIFPLIGAIINSILYLGLFIYILLVLFIGVTFEFLNM